MYPNEELPSGRNLRDEGTPYYGTESALAGALPVLCKLSETMNRPRIYSRTTFPFASFLLGGCLPPPHLLILEVTSPVSRHPRMHGNTRSSSVSLSTQACSPRAGRWRGFPSHEVRPTSSRHTGVGGIRRSWDSACDGPPSQGAAIPSEPLGAESRTLLHFPKFFLGAPFTSTTPAHITSMAARQDLRCDQVCYPLPERTQCSSNTI